MLTPFLTKVLEEHRTALIDSAGQVGANIDLPLYYKTTLFSGYVD